MKIRKETIFLSFAIVGMSFSLGACSVSRSPETYAANNRYSQTIEMISPEGNTIPDRAMF
ncbi:hypothetical protein GLF_2054 [Gluconobacter frateurii NBRC 101659]|nr:hypothetical protein GLF_2054 [Gluconobacter frateurii NBRC 101659]